ncbi:hypothetical protein WN48_04625 [Eufriesea mexicana]|uniref:Uncharacterized protein n=1 Tax=Eufriesea mexicana TaxID=516756 RepID=A0A310SSZ7_9HYME|nr:hypothetical protein WN48_04625 [Eufriesea mexicana]
MTSILGNDSASDLLSCHVILIQNREIGQKFLAETAKVLSGEFLEITSILGNDLASDLLSCHVILIQNREIGQKFLAETEKVLSGEFLEMTRRATSFHVMLS